MHHDGEFYRRLINNLYEGVYFVDCARKITFWSDGAAKLTGFAANEVKGSCCGDNILMHVDEKGNLLCERDLCPALLTMQDGKTRELEVCVHHKDGYRIPVFTHISPFRNEKGEIIGAVELFYDRSPVLNIKQENDELKKIALLDPLTELANRRYGEMQLKAKLSELDRYGWPFGVLFSDIDHFKKVNDIYGHHIGDRLLKMVSLTLAKNLRTCDFVCRWGGDEFLIILTNIDQDNLLTVAQKLRFLVEQSLLAVNGYHIRVTNSIGATLAKREDSVDSLLRRVDRMMYESKNAGRNQVSFS